MAGSALVAVADGAAAPELGKTCSVALVPQVHAPGLLDLVVDVVAHAVLLDPPLRVCAELHAPERALVQQREHLIDLESEELCRLRERQQARGGRGGGVHSIIMLAGAARRASAQWPVDNFGSIQARCVNMGGMTPKLRARRSRAFWSDTRFFIGIALVVASIAGVWMVVTSARTTVPVLVASRTIVAGEGVSSGALQVVQVSLGAAGPAYLAPGGLAEELVATRTIGAGELVPVGALAPAVSSRVTSVVVTSATEIPASVTTGSTVELWAAPRLERGEYGVPEILVADAVVQAVGENVSVMGRPGVSLELVIGRSEVSATLGAVASDWAFSIVPTAAG